MEGTINGGLPREDDNISNQDFGNQAAGSQQVCPTQLYLSEFLVYYL
jgi:hypothetical protein